MCYGKVAVYSQNLKWDDLWIQVRDYWLEITEKVGQPCSFVIPLDLTTLSGAFDETGIQNSICIVTASRTGSFKLFIQSTNRYDIIQLFQALKAGRDRLTEALSQMAIPRSCEFDVETTSGFLGLGKSKLRLSETEEGFVLAGSKGTQQFRFDDLQSVHARLNHSSAHTRICINIKEGGSTACREYNCLEHENLCSAIQTFLMNSFAWNEANAAARAEQLDLPPISTLE
jgi:hypothetical protein